MDSNFVHVPPDQLAPDTLRSVVEEFVTRDGTDYTEVEPRIRQVLELLASGEAELWFDRESQTCNIVSPGDREEQESSHDA